MNTPTKKGTPWTNQEEQYVKDFYGKISVKEMAETLGRTVKAVKQRANILGVNNKGWTEEDDDFVKSKYGKIPTKEMAEIIGKSPDAIRARAKLLGVKVKNRTTGRSWTEKDDQYIREHHKTLNYVELAKNLNRTVEAVRKRSGRLGYKSIRHWTHEEEQFIRDNYGKMKNEEIAKILGRTKGSVQVKALNLQVNNARKSRKQKNVD